jgi:hypothetical protein
MKFEHQLIMVPLNGPFVDVSIILDSASSQGWELVHVLANQSARLDAESSQISPMREFYFKRPIDGTV